jgi:hypothetical protein
LGFALALLSQQATAPSGEAEHRNELQYNAILSTACSVLELAASPPYLFCHFKQIQGRTWAVKFFVALSSCNKLMSAFQQGPCLALILPRRLIMRCFPHFEVNFYLCSLKFKGAEMRFLCSTEHLIMHRHQAYSNYGNVNIPPEWLLM